MEIGINVFQNTTLAIQLLNIFRVLADKERDAKLNEIIKTAFSPHVATQTGEESKIEMNFTPELVKKTVDTPVEEQERKNKISGEIPLGKPEMFHEFDDLMMCKYCRQTQQALVHKYGDLHPARVLCDARMHGIIEAPPKDCHIFGPDGLCAYCKRSQGDLARLHGVPDVHLRTCPEFARESRKKRIAAQTEKLERASVALGEPGVMKIKEEEGKLIDGLTEQQVIKEYGSLDNPKRFGE